MQKERSFFLKRLVLLDILMIIFALFFVFGPLAIVHLFNFAKLLFIFTVSSLSCILHFVISILQKPVSPGDIGIYVGVDKPFNYIILGLYALIILLSIYKEFVDVAGDGFTVFIRACQDIDYDQQLLFLDYLSKQENVREIKPMKHKLAMWLTILTQVLIIKMSWGSSAGAIFGVVSFSLIGLVCLILGLGFFRAGCYQIKFEKTLGFHPKPALRESFSLKSFIQQSQKNSY